MRHRVDGRKFGRNTPHRVAMLKNLANSVIEQERVITTLQKAKEGRRVVERLITLAKKDNLNSRRLAFDRTRNDEVVTKLFEVLIKRYDKRAGGYTRILKLADRRWGDAAEMAVLELVDADAKVLDRKRKPRVATDGTTAPAVTAEPQAAQDPFKRFRKMFSGNRKGAASTGPKKTAKAGKSAAPRKAKAGSSKSGSSGSA